MCEVHENSCIVRQTKAELNGICAKVHGAWCNMDEKAYMEQAIREYNKVILLAEGFDENFDGEVLEHVNITSPKILILSTKRVNVEEKRIVFKQIEKETAKSLYALYHTYEFADNFILLEQVSAFATIFNYVQTGILSMEEAWEALVGE